MYSSYWNMTERFKPDTWANLCAGDTWNFAMDRIWDMGGIMFSLRELATAGWELRLKQKSSLSRAKVIFEKDGSVISFRSEANMFKNRYKVNHDEFLNRIDYVDVFGGKWMPQMQMVEQTSRRLKPNHEPCTLSSDTKKDIYAVHGMAGGQIVSDVESGIMLLNDVDLIPRPIELGPEDDDIDKMARKLHLNSTYSLSPKTRRVIDKETFEPKVEIEDDEMVFFEIDPPSQHIQTVKQWLSMMDTQDLMDEILSRKQPRKRRRKKPQPMTPDNVVRLEEFIKRIKEEEQEDQIRVQL